MVLFGLCCIISIVFIYFKTKLWPLFCVSAIVISGTILLVAQLSVFGDIEILNGKVTSKTRDVVDCEHDYQCNCTQICSTVGKGNSSCTKVCQTCYEHDYDVDWTVHTTVGNYTIDRLDRQGLKKPGRWDIVKTGEPASTTHVYQNYILGNKDSLFNKTKEMDFTGIPDYPKIYDYYRVNHVINQTSLDVVNETAYINDRLKDDGAKKQVNVVVILTYSNQEFFEKLKNKWLGFKKNDLIMVYGLNKDNTLSWFEGGTFADGMKNKDMLNSLRANIISKPLNIKEDYDYAVKYFNRIPMSEFEDLKDSYETPLWAYILAITLTIVLNILIIKVGNNEGSFSSISYSNRFNRINRR